MILSECEWLSITPSGLSQLLKRLRIHYKRGRCYFHSPDPDYEAKYQLIQQTLQQVRANPDRLVLLYLDELSFYQHPSVGYAYAASGSSNPLARLSYGYNNRFRGIGALNALTGQVTYEQYARISIWRIAAFYSRLADQYRQADQIYLVLDNWPQHFHVDVVARLQPQHWPFPVTFPPRWPTEPTSRAVHDDLPIQLLGLPTYASWLNPIEKLWRHLKQAVLHLHRMSNDWPKLKQTVMDFMLQYEYGSPELLSYVGLLPN